MYTSSKCWEMFLSHPEPTLTKMSKWAEGWQNCKITPPQIALSTLIKHNFTSFRVIFMRDHPYWNELYIYFTIEWLSTEVSSIAWGSKFLAPWLIYSFQLMFALSSEGTFLSIFLRCTCPQWMLTKWVNELRDSKIAPPQIAGSTLIKQHSTSF